MNNTIVAGYFIPKDRHLDVEGKQVVLSDNDLRMLSFITGRRGCPGVVLGSTITTMMLAIMVQSFTWEAPPNESGIKLDENDDGLSLANPLVLVAKPRLPQYQALA
ncbi:hypothetical protein L2E82_10289 [Cichorium intybus]|uniref:Uncharacterized protein n=1 Tax=Cichorium intybus TaxID=13427 RepID=A0ACB9GC62_CICIN|nr:hypothetical protein L2E82_10289 [Cichorium intybus]